MLMRFKCGRLRLDRHDFSVGRRNGHRTRGNFPVGIAEEIQAERRQEPQRNREPRAHQPGENPAGRRQAQRVINAVDYNHSFHFHMGRH